MRDKEIEEQPLQPLKRKTGRPAGSQNKVTVDQRELEKSLVESEGLMSVTEIAFRLANETYQSMLTVEEKYGCDSKIYRDTASLAINAARTALPYFAIQSKALVITDDENFDVEEVEKRISEKVNKWMYNQQKTLKNS